MKHQKMIFYLLFIGICSWSPLSFGANYHEVDTPKIQIALLLDISGSMNGLISQTQGQLWNLANTLSNYKKEEKNPNIELAVIAYGSGTQENRHTEILSPFTTNIDIISEKIFGLQTFGSEEWCADALQIALDSLSWSTDTSDLKVMIMAGNERFDQSAMPYDSICAAVGKRGILLNTVFCGDRETGVAMLWESAAIIGNGSFTNINQNLELKREETPFDSKIIQMYDQYKATYIFFGDNAFYNFKRIEEQDLNTLRMGKSFFRERIIYKLRNEPLKSYDLIDVFESNEDVVDEIPKEDLPEALQNLSKQELQKFLFQQYQKREVLKNAIDLYGQQVENYYHTIDKNQEEKTFEIAIQEIIEAQLLKKGFLKN
jgi:hypothetical protein